MYQPQILEVDPQRIKFNKLNPRKHGGEEYESLKQSIQEIGIVQPPLVRHTTGIFYEVIDGEGRVAVAQDLGMPTIKVINLGDIRDDEALEMLVVSNAVRQFDFFARCKGMAAMHRKGKTAEQISKELGVPYPGMVIRDMGIGYFPEEMLDRILSSISKDSAMLQVWSNHTMIYEMLPLRIPIKDTSTFSGSSLDGGYDYSEVKKAIEQVIAGKISNGVEMRAYVAEQRRERYEQQFNEELQKRLQDEIARAEKALEDAKALDIEKAGEKARQTYQIQIDTLEAQLSEVRKERDDAREATAASERDKKLIKELQQMVDAQKKADSKAKESIRDEERKKAEAEYKEWKEKYEVEVKARREAAAKELAEKKTRQEREEAEARERLEAYYKDQDAKRKLKAETSYRQLVASASEHLSQSRQSILHITSEGMIRGTEWLSQEELGGLLFDMRAVRNTLEEAEQAIQQRLGVISSSETIIDNENEQVPERSLVNHA